MTTVIKKITLLSLLAAGFLSGCQVVSVKNQSLNVTIANERDSILSRNKLSEASLNVLSMTGREAKLCSENPDECVSALKSIPQIQDEQLLSTASELYLARALAYESSSDCKVSILSNKLSEEKQKTNQQNYDKCLDNQMQMLDKSIRYSYAYMFKTKRNLNDRIFDNRQVQIRDFYNLAIAKLSNAYSLKPKPAEFSPNIRIGDKNYIINLDNYPALKEQKIDNFMSTYNMNFSGLRSITRRDGFGSEFLVVLADPNPPQSSEKAQYIVDPFNHKYPNGSNPNIHDVKYLAATITAEPIKASSIDEIINNSTFQFKVYDPYKHENVSIANKSFPLAANFSAPYGLWLAENNLVKHAFLSLIDRDDRLTSPHLFMLEPYNPNKKVIVLVHGLASSPEAWIRLTNDIMGDPVLRENYQVWQVFYSTNMPILESRFQVYAVITQAFDKVDSSASAKKDAVLIGHSMGGIISRLLVSDADLTQPALELFDSRRITKFKDDPLFKARLQLHHVPNFGRAIFVSSPHRGTEFADRWFTLAARKIIKLPSAFLGAFADTLQEGNLNMKEIVKDMGHGLIQNGPSDLSKNSKFTELTKDVVPYKGFKYHSIIGNHTNSDDPDIISDDVVPYRSAHLADAVSEKVIKGGHSIQETPEAVLELRRILRLHLTELGLYKP
jgi:triacylglycerol esterase/lipase EstA (alpha/beta hydrolase family)